ncbi:MAG: hypothetical protein QOI03_1892 [Solirubrobacteraceae bacterium]|jgi:hypothetical protein|nr:hypothetical protein [Solirubrobacteraceae bacterium]
MIGIGRRHASLMAVMLPLGASVAVASDRSAQPAAPLALTLSVPLTVPSTPALPSASTPVLEGSTTGVTVPSLTVGAITTPSLTATIPSTPPSGVPSLPPAAGTPAPLPTLPSPLSTTPSTSSSRAPSASASSGTTRPGAGAPARATTRSRQARRSLGPSSTRRPARRSNAPAGTRAGGVATGLPSGASPAPSHPAAAARVAPAATHASANPLESIGRHIPLPIPVPDWSKPIILALLLAAAWFAGRTRIVASRARRLERQRASLLRDVGVMQGALVPELPASVGGLEVSVAYRPAEGPAAGGDFYDVFALADGRVAIVLGDVAGHGHDALTDAALIRYTLRAYVQAGLEPRHALALAGEALAHPADAHFATVAVGVYERRASRLTYALAGHPPPIFRGFSTPEPLTIYSSGPVGTTVPTGRRQTTLALPAGSEVFFFSDGLIEARTREGLLGRDGLTKVLDTLEARAHASELLERIRAEVESTPDDMAACIVAPETSADVCAFHLEELEASAHDLDGGAVERFLAACSLRAEDIARTVALASEIANESGSAMVRVERHADGAVATASAPTDRAPLSQLAGLTTAPAA